MTHIVTVKPAAGRMPRHPHDAFHLIVPGDVVDLDDPYYWRRVAEADLILLPGDEAPPAASIIVAVAIGDGATSQNEAH